MKRTRRHFSREFKVEAVRQLLGGNVPPRWSLASWGSVRTSCVAGAMN